MKYLSYNDRTIQRILCLLPRHQQNLNTLTEGKGLNIHKETLIKKDKEILERKKQSNRNKFIDHKEPRVKGYTPTRDIVDYHSGHRYLLRISDRRKGGPVRLYIYRQYDHRRIYGRIPPKQDSTVTSVTEVSEFKQQKRLPIYVLVTRKVYIFCLTSIQLTRYLSEKDLEGRRSVYGMRRGGGMVEVSERSQVVQSIQGPVACVKGERSTPNTQDS